MTRARVLVVAMAVVAAGCSSGGGDAPASPSAAGTSPAPATTEPTGSPTPQVFEISGPCCAGLELDEGPYLSPAWFRLPFTIDVPAGWFAVTDRREETMLLGRDGTNQIDHLDHYLAMFVVEDAEALLEEGRATPMADIGAPAEFTAGELSGPGFDARARANDAPPEDDEIVAGSIAIPVLDGILAGFWWTESPRARFRLWAVDRGEADLLIYMEAPAGDFEAFVADAEELISRMDFE